MCRLILKVSRIQDLYNFRIINGQAVVFNLQSNVKRLGYMKTQIALPPFFLADGLAAWPMSNLQRQYLSQLKENIHTQQYTFISNPCLCGAEPGNDLLISQKDRFGLPVNVVMCSHCGLLRNEMVFSQESCAQFYGSSGFSVGS